MWLPLLQTKLCGFRNERDEVDVGCRTYLKITHPTNATTRNKHKTLSSLNSIYSILEQDFMSTRFTITKCTIIIIIIHHHHHHHHQHQHHSKASTKKKCTNAPTTFQQENPWHPHCFPSPPHHKTLLEATAAKKLFVVATVVVGLLARERERLGNHDVASFNLVPHFEECSPMCYLLWTLCEFIFWCGNFMEHFLFELLLVWIFAIKGQNLGSLFGNHPEEN